MSSTTTLTLLLLLLAVGTTAATAATAPHSLPGSAASSRDDEDDDPSGRHHISRLKKLAEELSATVEQIQKSMDHLLNNGGGQSTAALHDFEAGVNVLDCLTRFLDAVKCLIFSSRDQNAREHDRVASYNVRKHDNVDDDDEEEEL